MSYLIPSYLDHLRAAGCTPRTLEVRANTLRVLHAALPVGLAYAATDTLEAWLANPGWSRWTRVTYAATIRSFFAWATRAGILDGDPAAAMVRPSRPALLPHPITTDELAVVLTSPEPWYTICILGAYAGLRADEIAHQRREDITETLTRIPDGKGDQPGVVPTHPLIWATVQDRAPGLLVLDARGHPTTGKALSSAACRHFDRLGLPEVHLHRLRHWYGTAVLEATGDVRVAQECLRHKSITSTQGYTLVTGVRRATAVAALPVPGSARRATGP